MHQRFIMAVKRLNKANQRKFSNLVWCKMQLREFYHHLGLAYELSPAGIPETVCPLFSVMPSHKGKLSLWEIFTSCTYLKGAYTCSMPPLPPPPIFFLLPRNTTLILPIFASLHRVPGTTNNLKKLSIT